MLRGLVTNKATGLDSIPAKFLRDAAEFIALYVTHIINLSISQPKVPQDLKNARVTALYKNSCKAEQSSNYRSVSVLSVFSRILERVLYEQIFKYVNQFNSLYDLQSGFG